MGKKAEKKMRKLEEKYMKFTDKIAERESIEAENIIERISFTADILRSISPASIGLNTLSEAFDAVQIAVMNLRDDEATLVAHIL